MKFEGDVGCRVGVSGEGVGCRVGLSGVGWGKGVSGGGKGSVMVKVEMMTFGDGFCHVKRCLSRQKHCRC